MVARCPEEVRVGEEQLWLSILLPAIVRERSVAVLFRICPQYSFLRKEQVEDDLRIECPITWIVEHKYSVESEGLGGVRKLHGTRERSSGLLVIVGENLVEGPNGRVLHEDVARCYDVLKAVPGRET